MAHEVERFRAAARQCVHAAYRCIDDPDAAAALLKTAQDWIELADTVEPPAPVAGIPDPAARVRKH
jgi:hypothetical protein